MYFGEIGCTGSGYDRTFHFLYMLYMMHWPATCCRRSTRCCQWYATALSISESLCPASVSCPLPPGSAASTSHCLQHSYQ